jgi:mono/diheme cytochrome c family protein
VAGFIRSALLPIALWLVSGVVAATALTQDANRKEPSPAQQQPAQPPGQGDYDRVCKACHGPEARGDAGPRLVPFTREYEETLGIVREGSGQMPPIATRELSDEAVAQIVEYLKSLSP